MLIAPLFLAAFLRLISTELITRQTDPGAEIFNDLINAGKTGADALGSLFETGAEDLGNAVDFFFNPNRDGSASTTQPSPAPPPANGASNEEKPSTPSDNIAPLINTACNPQLPNQCKVASPHIIWPQRCDSQNEALSAYLAEQVIDKPVYISYDRGCGGVDFWATELTEAQVNDVRGIKGILAVEPDEPVSLHSLHRLEKRDVLSSRIDPHGYLSFISNAPRTPMSSRYFYFSKAGKNIVIYHIDTGVEFLHQEFQHSRVLKRVLCAIGAVNSPTDEFGHGTCLGSLICGKNLGVANEVSMVVVKFFPQESSILDALQLVIDDLLDRVRDGQEVAGYTVVATSFGWIGRGYSKDVKLKERIKRLLNEFQAVVVAAAGDTSIGSAQESLQHIPAVWSTEKDFPLIVVGALDLSDGKRYDWSLTGDHVTLLAPGLVSCALNQPGDTTIQTLGTSQAAALITGVVGYLLSLDDLGPVFRSTPSVPLAVRNWIVDKAYKRGDGADEDKAVWTGLKVLRGSTTNFRWYPDLGVNP